MVLLFASAIVAIGWHPLHQRYRKDIAKVKTRVSEYLSRPVPAVKSDALQTEVASAPAAGAPAAHRQRQLDRVTNDDRKQLDSLLKGLN